MGVQNGLGFQNKARFGLPPELGAAQYVILESAPFLGNSSTSNKKESMTVI